MKKEKPKCKDCNTELKIKLHYEGCSYNNNSGTETQIDFHYCPECSRVYYFYKIKYNPREHE